MILNKEVAAAIEKVCVSRIGAVIWLSNLGIWLSNLGCVGSLGDDAKKYYVGRLSDTAMLGSPIGQVASMVAA